MKKNIAVYLKTLLALLLLSSQSTYSQGYKIDASIEGLSDTTLLLSYRYGTKFYSIDTTRTDNKGKAVFESTDLLERGMYQIVLPDKSFLDFFVDKEQQINIKTNSSSIVENLRSDNSSSNEEFFNWQRENQNLRKKAQNLQTKINSVSKESPEYSKLQSELAQLRNANKNLWDEAIEKLDNQLPGKFLRGMRPFEIPPGIAIGPDGKTDQKAQYQYYKDHFFDNVDFSDAALIRTPLIHSKLEQFFTKVVDGIPDSVNVFADKVCTMAEANPEMFQYTVQYLLNHYSDPKIMGMDAVYVHMADNYYLNGRATWVEEDNLKYITERVKVLKPLLIGKPAPPLVGLETTEGERIDIRDIEAKYTILYFWEPECSFCKTATPILRDVYHKLKDEGVTVLAVNTRIDKEPWEAFIAEYELDWLNVYAPDDVRDVLTKYEAFSTPKVFILDEEKKIVAKDIAVDQTEGLLEYLLGNQK